MAVKNTTNPRTRAAIAGAALLIAATFSTCGFLTDDVFPRWLSYVEASVDLRGILVDQGLGATAFIENLEYAPYVTGGTDYSKVLVFAAGNGTAKLLMLDPVKLDFAFVNTDVAFTRALATTANGFMCGKRIVDPLNPGNAPSVAHDWTNNASSVRVFRVGDPGAGLNYSVDPLSSEALFESYPSVWGTATTSLTRNFDADGEDYNLLDADFANGFSVLAERKDNLDSWQGYAANFALAGDFTAGGTVFDSAAALDTGPFPVANEMAWLTKDGPVAFYRSDKGSNRLVRYKWGTGNFATGVQSEEVDSLAFDENDVSILSFDPSGAWWFIYDRVDGRLYKLRTWWK